MRGGPGLVLTLATAAAAAACPVIAQEDVTAVDEVVVTATTTSATKTETPLVEIPSSLTVIDERRLEDRNPQTLNQIVGYVPGVNTGNYGFDTRYDAFFIRGFQATYTGVFRDGLRQLNSPSGIYRNEPYAMESLTILRGPASVLYGASGAGGLVDIVSKRPTGDSFGEVEVQVGSHDRYQLNGDFGGASGDLSWRLTGVARTSETQNPGYPDDRVMIAPAVTWAVSDDTTITFLGEYMDSKTGGSAAYYNDAGGITNIPLADPRFNDFDHEQWRLGWAAEHRFDNGLTLRQNLRFQEIDAYLEYAYVIDPTTTPVTRASGVAAEDVRSFNVDNQAHYTLTSGIVSHRLLFGVDYNRVAYDSREGYGAVPATGPVPTPALFHTVSQTFEQTGVYAQDQIEFGRFGLVAGIRHDWLDATTERPLTPTLNQDDSVTTGRVGVTYDLGAGFVPYANWSSSFEPNIGLLVNGDPAQPTEARQVEAGVKYQVPGRRILVTAAVFDIEQTDGVVFDASSGVNQQVQLDLRSRGAELELSARLAEGLDLTAAYAYTDVEIERGATGTTGNTLSATPEHMWSIWADYRFGQGFGLGGGLRYFGESFGNDQNTIENDDRVFADAVVHWDVPGDRNLRLQLNATNLTGERPVSCAAGYCYREQGRTLLASARYRF